MGTPGPDWLSVTTQRVIFRNLFAPWEECLGTPSPDRPSVTTKRVIFRNLFALLGGLPPPGAGLPTCFAL